MPRFKLESSRQGQKKKDKKMERDINDMLNYLDIDDDSGAAEHVASRETAPNCERREQERPEVHHGERGRHGQRG